MKNLHMELNERIDSVPNLLNGELEQLKSHFDVLSERYSEALELIKANLKSKSLSVSDIGLGYKNGDYILKITVTGDFKQSLGVIAISESCLLSELDELINYRQSVVVSVAVSQAKYNFATLELRLNK